MPLPSTTAPPPELELGDLPDAFFHRISTPFPATEVLPLTKTSKYLNHEALLKYFTTHGFSLQKGPFDDDVLKYDASRTPGPVQDTFAQALSIVFRACKVRKLTYRFQLPISRLLHEIRCLTAFILRLENVEDVCLDFRLVDEAVRARRKVYWSIIQPESLSLEACKQALGDLMDATQKKGIQAVSVERGSTLVELLPPFEIILQGEGPPARVVPMAPVAPILPQADDSQVVDSGDSGQQIAEPSSSATVPTEAIVPTLTSNETRSEDHSTALGQPPRRSRFQKLRSLFSSRSTISPIAPSPTPPIVSPPPTKSTIPPPNTQSRTQQVWPLLPSEPCAVVSAEGERVLASTRFQLAPGTKALQIDTPIFLLHPFSGWTTDFVMRDSSRLCVLTLSDQTLDPAPWKRILDALYLPNLQRFAIETTLFVDREGASFEDLMDFLRRHPTITHLTMHGMQLSDRQLTYTPKHTILPRLEELKCHPWYATVIIKSHVLSKQDTCSLSPIRRVHLTREEYGSWHPRYDSRGPPYATEPVEFEHALHALCLLPNTNDTTLVFGFPPTEDSHEPWMQHHISLGSTKSVIGHLSSVRKVVFDCGYLGNFTPRGLVNTLPAFLNLFPDVREAGIEEFGTNTKPPNDLEAIWRKKCRTVKTFHFTPKISGWISTYDASLTLGSSPGEGDTDPQASMAADGVSDIAASTTQQTTV